MISIFFRFRRHLLVLFLPCLVTGGLCLAADDPLQSMQKTAAELSRLRSETAELNADWKWQREAMTATIEALQQRATALEQEAALHEARSSAARQEESALAARTARLREQLTTVEAQLRTVSDQLLTLRAWLPPRLSAALDLPYEGLADPATTTTERMQHIGTIWARCGQFNRAITLAEEALDLDAGANPRVMEVIYWGLSHGYALDRSGQTAYVGSPGPEGWSWREDAELASRLSTLIAVYRDELEPQFVPVPTQITHPFAATR